MEFKEEKEEEQVVLSVLEVEVEFKEEGGFGGCWRPRRNRSI